MIIVFIGIGGFAQVFVATGNVKARKYRVRSHRSVGLVRTQLLSLLLIKMNEKITKVSYRSDPAENARVAATQIYFEKIKNSSP